MEPQKKENNRDFLIIFKEMENFNQEDPSVKNNMVSDEDLKQDETIRAFGEICKEINMVENSSAVFLTFS